MMALAQRLRERQRRRLQGDQGRRRKSATDQSDQMATALTGTPAGDKLKATTASISDLAVDLADQLDTQTNQRQEIEQVQLEKAGTKLAAQLAALTKSIVDGQTALGAQADAGTAMTNTLLSVISGVANDG